MNSFQGHIEKVETHGKLSIVSIEMGFGIILKAIVIDDILSAPHLEKGRKIQVMFKETEVILSSELSSVNVSIENRIQGRVSEIEKGQLLSRVKIDSPIGAIISVISTEALINLKLNANTEILAMVKLNEIILSK
jgi:molybdate transport system regulatory protein